MWRRIWLGEEVEMENMIDVSAAEGVMGGGEAEREREREREECVCSEIGEDGVEHKANGRGVACVMLCSETY